MNPNLVSKCCGAGFHQDGSGEGTFTNVCDNCEKDCDIETRDFGAKNQPVKVGEHINIAISRFGTNGDPIAMYNGLVIFVKNTDRNGVDISKIIELKITKVFPKYAFAERVL